MWHTDTVEFDFPVKKKIIMNFAGKWIGQENIMMQRMSDFGVLSSKWSIYITIQPKVHESSQKVCKGQRLGSLDERASPECNEADPLSLQLLLS